MTETPDTPATPPGHPAGKPRGKQLVILIFGGIALAIGGCLLFLATYDSLGSIVFALAFGAGLLMFVAGVALGIVLLLVRVFRGSGR